MSTPDPSVDILQYAKHQEAKFNELGFQLIGSDINNPHIARFGDKAELCPLVIEYQVNTWGMHQYKLTVRTLGMGITMESPWVTWGDDTFMPRLRRMRHYAGALREVFASAPK